MRSYLDVVAAEAVLVAARFAVLTVFFDEALAVRAVVVVARLAVVADPLAVSTSASDASM